MTEGDLENVLQRLRDGRWLDGSGVLSGDGGPWSVLMTVLRDVVKECKRELALEIVIAASSAALSHCSPRPEDAASIDVVVNHLLTLRAPAITSEPTSSTNRVPRLDLDRLPPATYGVHLASFQSPMPSAGRPDALYAAASAALCNILDCSLDPPSWVFSPAHLDKLMHLCDGVTANPSDIHTLVSKLLVSVHDEPFEFDEVVRGAYACVYLSKTQAQKRYPVSTNLDDFIAVVKECLPLPALPRLTRVFRTECEWVLTTERVGWDLGRQRHLMTPQQRVAAAKSICDLVCSLHASGVVHGDLNPSNVLVDGETVLLTDMGSSCIGLPSANINVTPRLLRGTPGFAAPEAWDFSGNYYELSLPYPADVYSTGSLIAWLFIDAGPDDIDLELLSGRLPERLSSVCLSSRQDDPQARPALSDLVEALVAQ